MAGIEASANEERERAAGALASGATLTLTIEAGPQVPADAAVSIYLVDRSEIGAAAFRQARSSRPLGAWDVVERFGEPLTAPTPLQGNALTLELPAPAAGTSIYARAGDFFGVYRVKDHQGAPPTQRAKKLTLLLLALDPKPVRVFRFSGEPAASVRVRGAVLRGGVPPRNLRFERASLSGQDGVANAYQTAKEDGFAAEVHGHRPVPATRDSEGWRIDLPSMGTVRFTLPPGSRNAEIHLYSKDQGVLSLDARGDGDGPLEFSCIARGASLSYVAKIEGANAHGDVTPVSKDGETVEVSPDFRALRRISMHLSQDGVPLEEGTKVVVLIKTPLRGRFGANTTHYFHAEKVGRDGHSSLRVDDEAVDLSVILKCRVVAFPRFRGSGPPVTALASVPFASTDDGSFDLGHLGMGPLPLVASGMVTDSAGQPIAGARVSVRQE